MGSRRAFLAQIGVGIAGLLLPGVAQAHGFLKRCRPARACRCRRCCPKRLYDNTTFACPLDCYADVNGVCYYRCHVCSNSSDTCCINMAHPCIDPNQLPMPCGAPGCFLVGSIQIDRCSCPFVVKPYATAHEFPFYPVSTDKNYDVDGLDYYIPSSGNVNPQGHPYSEDGLVPYNQHPDGKPRKLRLITVTINNGQDQSNLRIGHELDPGTQTTTTKPSIYPEMRSNTGMT
jgi:hypothetical protein